MKSPWPTRTFLLVTVSFMLSCLGLLQSFTIDTTAQPLPQATPTNCNSGGFDCSSGSSGSGSGGNNNDDDDDDSGSSSAPIPPGAQVYGYVYNYSDAAYAGGITVVLEGDSWQAEAVTDSNGFYKIGHLDGNGWATLNLRLPPNGPQPATANWPIGLSSDAGIHVDLGYYWGNTPPIPVIVSGQQQDNQLILQIENRTSVTATGGLLEISPSTNKKVSPPITLTQGGVAAFNPHHFQIAPGELTPDSTANITLHLKDQGVSTATDSSIPQIVRVVFTYDQQITPQVLEFDLNDNAPAIAAVTQTETQSNIQADTSQTTSTQTETSNQTSAKISSNVSSETTSTDPTPEANQPQENTADASQSEPEPPETSSQTTTDQPPGISPLPETGTSTGVTNIIILALASLLVLGLALGGWQATKKD